MNPIRKILLGSLLLAGLSLAWSGCVAHGYVGVSNDVYYGPHRDPWFRDDSWMDARPWYRDSSGGASIGIYIHPPRHGR